MRNRFLHVKPISELWACRPVPDGQPLGARLSPKHGAARVGFLVLVLAAFVSIGGAAELADVPARFETMEDVWRGYDPEALPLEIEVVKSWQEDGCWFEKLRFTGEVVDGAKTRIIAVRGGPVGAKNVPGVLHIHGGGQTFYPGWVKFWAQRGYACVSFDFCGKAYDRTEYTDWGPLERCNMPMAGDGYFVKPDVRASSWYHWVVACRRSLTLLAQTPGVDRNRLGIFGISVGGTLCWMVAGCDHRVKVAAPIYGCGYNIDPRRPSSEAGPPTRDQLEFKRLLSLEACAPYIKCPVLFLSATNDMHGRMPTAYEILGVVDAPVRQVFTPRYDHHVEPEQAKDLPLWMDWHLKGGRPFPKSPKIEVGLDRRGVPTASVEADEAGQVHKVEVYYSLGDKVPGARFWRTVRAEKSRGTWRASLPVLDTWKSLSAFANVFYIQVGSLPEFKSGLHNPRPARQGASDAQMVCNNRRRRRSRRKMVLRPGLHRSVHRRYLSERGRRFLGQVPNAQP
ncbi:MAG: alpha/beta hydrolase family protein, partial [Armatimonadota bacterium]